MDRVDDLTDGNYDKFMKSASLPIQEQEVTTAELAHIFGVSVRAVQLMGDKGLITKGEKDGRWKLAASVAAYVQSLKTDRKAKSGTYEAAKLKEKEAKARLAELEANEREGKLLELSLVQQTCGNIVTAFTNRLANFGDGLSSICHQQNGEFVSQRINEGLRSALRELSKMPYVPQEKD